MAMTHKSRQHPGMRYGPAENLLRLARHLAATRTGLTLDEMAAELGIGRRTAERMRDVLMTMFPQMECRDDDGRMRRWLLPASALLGMVSVRAEAVAAVETAARECEANGEADRTFLLREASTTLRAMMRPEALRRAEPDIAALMEAEGVAMRPGPRPVLVAGVLPTLRRAILGLQLVVVRYAGPNTEEPATRILCPYGIPMVAAVGWLRTWTVCLKCGCGGWIGSCRSICLIAPRNVGKISIWFGTQHNLSGCFRRIQSTSLLRFEPEAATDAAGWLFHPTQAMEREPSGALLVRFRAGGMQEICWHLFTWGTAVMILAPAELRRHLATLAIVTAAHHGEEPDRSLSFQND